jgi:hypothetical protein
MFHALAMRRLQRGQPKQLPQQAKLQQRPQLIFDFLIYLAISKICPFGIVGRWFLSVCGGQLSSFFGLMKPPVTRARFVGASVRLKLIPNLDGHTSSSSHIFPCFF